MMISLSVLFLGIFVAVSFTAAAGGALVGHDVPMFFNVRLFLYFTFFSFDDTFYHVYLISIKLVLLFLI